MPFPIALVTSRFMYTTFHQRLGHCALENLGLEYVAAPLVAAGFPVDMYSHEFLKLTTEQLARRLGSGSQVLCTGHDGGNRSRRSPGLSDAVSRAGPQADGPPTQVVSDVPQFGRKSLEVIVIRNQNVLPG